MFDEDLSWESFFVAGAVSATGFRRQTGRRSWQPAAGRKRRCASWPSTGLCSFVAWRPWCSATCQQIPTVKENQEDKFLTCLNLPWNTVSYSVFHPYVSLLARLPATRWGHNRYPTFLLPRAGGRWQRDWPVPPATSFWLWSMAGFLQVKESTTRKAWYMFRLHIFSLRKSMYGDGRQRKYGRMPTLGLLPGPSCCGHKGRFCMLVMFSNAKQCQASSVISVRSAIGSCCSRIEDKVFLQKRKEWFLPATFVFVWDLASLPACCGRTSSTSHHQWRRRRRWSFPRALCTCGRVWMRCLGANCRNCCKIVGLFAWQLFITCITRIHCRLQCSRKKICLRRG